MCSNGVTGKQKKTKTRGMDSGTGSRGMIFWAYGGLTGKQNTTKTRGMIFWADGVWHGTAFLAHIFLMENTDNFFKINNLKYRYF